MASKSAADSATMLRIAPSIKSGARDHRAAPGMRTAVLDVGVLDTGTS